MIFETETKISTSQKSLTGRPLFLLLHALSLPPSRPLIPQPRPPALPQDAIFERQRAFLLCEGVPALLNEPDHDGLYFAVALLVFFPPGVGGWVGERMIKCTCR